MAKSSKESGLVKPQISPDGAWSFFDGDLKLYPVKSSPGSFTSGQVFKSGSPHTGVGRSSTATPPYHYHLYQTETFDVKSGVLCYLIDGKAGKLKAGQKVSIPPYRCHTFWSDSETKQDLDVHITVSGGDKPGFDEDFVRNFYGYLASVTLAGRPPNPFQMFRFLDDADVIIVAPLPLFSLFSRLQVIAAIGTFFNVVIGRWIGGYLFGLPTRYKLFSEA